MTALIDAEAPFESDELSLRDYLALLQRRWWIVVAAALGLGLLAFVFSMLQTRTYQASSEVLLRTAANDQLFSSVPFTQQLDVQRSALAEVDYIQSDRFVDELEAAGATERVAVDVPQVDAGDRNQTGNVLRFTSVGNSGFRVAETANLAAETYIAARQQDALDDFDRRMSTEVDELATRQNELAALIGPLAELQARIDASTDTESANRLRDELATLRAGLTSERIPLEQSVSTLEARIEESSQVRSSIESLEISARVNKVAETPDSPISPKPLRNVLIGLALGAMAGVAAALAWESIDDKLSHADDVTAHGVTVLASIPIDGPEVEGPRLFARIEESGREMEAFRTARAALNFASEGRLSSFLVTSALPGEGKSTTSANLATALSLAGQKTLLIDADLRRPTLHKYFDLPNNVGLRSVLTGDADANDVMNVTGLGEMLVLISAGAVAPLPSELLSNGRLAMLIAGAKEVFDVIIIDTPPLFLVSDAALVAPSVDGIVLSCTTGMGDTPASKKSDNRRLIAAVRRLRTPLLGAVVHGGGSDAYGYGYKYGYYAAEETPLEKQQMTVQPEIAQANGSGLSDGSQASNGSAPAVDSGWIEDRIDVGPGTKG